VRYDNVCTVARKVYDLLIVNTSKYGAGMWTRDGIVGITGSIVVDTGTELDSNFGIVKSRCLICGQVETVYVSEFSDVHVTSATELV